MRDYIRLIGLSLATYFVNIAACLYISCAHQKSHGCLSLPSDVQNIIILTIKVFRPVNVEVTHGARELRYTTLLPWRLQSSPRTSQPGGNIWGELTTFLRIFSPAKDLLSATPEDIVSFLIWEDNSGKKLVHVPTCTHLPKKDLVDNSLVLYTSRFWNSWFLNRQVACDLWCNRTYHHGRLVS